MDKIGLIYSFNTNKTKLIAEKIVDAFGNYPIEPINVENIDEAQMMKCNLIIAGVPTWFDGELPNYWDEFVPALEDLDLSGKKIALFGLGDQKGYPENFCDAIGILADILENQGADIVGYTSIKGYTFEHSKALRGDKFCGLVVDQENQAKLTNQRVEDWVSQLKLEFNIN